LLYTPAYLILSAPQVYGASACWSLEPARGFKAAASSWLPNALAADRDELPVVWHSVTQMHWSTEEVMAVERILRNYGARQRLGEVSLEYDLHDQRDVKPELRTRLWSPDGDHSIRECLLGTAHHHGVPVTLAADGS
jgi:hypothetical protein